MNIGFLILAHKNPRQLMRLMDLLLDYEGAVLFVHVDLKSQGLYHELSGCYAGHPRVVIIRERYKVFWGGYGQILATLALLRSANAWGRLHYCCLISGQDLPVQPLSRFADYLHASNGREFLSYQELPIEQWADGGYGRMSYFSLNSERYPGVASMLNVLIYRLQTTLRYERKRVPFALYGGANWFNLSAAAVDYICWFVHRHPEYLAAFRYTRCADELFVQTILLNSPFRERIVNDDLRLVDWGTGPEFPRTYRMQDLDRLMSPGTKFIARKFDEAVDNGIINQVISRH